MSNTYTRHKWTKEELDKLQELSKLPIVEIAKHFPDRKYISVAKKVEEMQLHNPNKFRSAKKLVAELIRRGLIEKHYDTYVIKQKYSMPPNKEDASIGQTT